MKKIKELMERELFDLPLLLTRSVSGTANNGTAYLSLLLQDSSGTIEAKVWDVKPEIEAICQIGKIIRVKGQINLYQNSRQVKVLEVSPLKQEDFNLLEYVQAAKIPEDQLRKGISEAVDGISNTILNDICKKMVAKYDKQLYSYPAASRNHHDYYGGLAVHITTMIELVTAICRVYPDLNQDLLMAGVILHDIGKIDELSGPVATEYTTEGKLLGHISMMQSEIAEYAKSKGWLDKEEVLLVRHLILSHHGELEFGSPVLPLTKEAEVLSLIDNLDAKMTMIDKALEEVEEGGFSTKVYSLNGRSFYKAKMGN